MTLQLFLLAAAALFAIGLYGALSQQSIVMLMMGLELMRRILPCCWTCGGHLRAKKSRGLEAQSLAVSRLVSAAPISASLQVPQHLSPFAIKIR